MAQSSTFEDIIDKYHNHSLMPIQIASADHSSVLLLYNYLLFSIRLSRSLITSELSTVQLLGSLQSESYGVTTLRNASSIPFQSTTATTLGPGCSPTRTLFAIGCPNWPHTLRKSSMFAGCGHCSRRKDQSCSRS